MAQQRKWWEHPDSQKAIWVGVLLGALALGSIIVLLALSKRV